MKHVVAAMLLVVGLIHLLPVSGVVGSAQLTALYGLPFDEPNLEILMRHRAVLFGLLGAFLVLAAFRPAYRTLAFVAGFASVLSFLWLAGSVGGTNPGVARVVTADWVALGALVIGAVAHGMLRRRQA